MSLIKLLNRAGTAGARHSLQSSRGSFLLIPDLWALRIEISVLPGRPQVCTTLQATPGTFPASPPPGSVNPLPILRVLAARKLALGSGSPRDLYGSFCGHSRTAGIQPHLVKGFSLSLWQCWDDSALSFFRTGATLNTGKRICSVRDSPSPK